MKNRQRLLYETIIKAATGEPEAVHTGSKSEKDLLLFCCLVGKSSEKSRYGADQMRAIVTTLEIYEGMDAVEKALDYWIRHLLDSRKISLFMLL